MIRFDRWNRLFTQTTDSIRFKLPQTGSLPYEITYLSENSSFLEDFNKLNFRIADARITIIPYTIYPRTKLTANLVKEYKKLSLIPIQSNRPVPKKRNIFYDITNYLNAIDLMFKPQHYRQRYGRFLMNSISNSFSNFQDYEKILLYTIDLRKDVPLFINRKIFPVLESIKDNQFHFDHLVLGLITDGGIRYKLLMKNRNTNINRLIPTLKQIKQIKSGKDEIEDVEDEELDNATDHVVSNISDKINPHNQEKIRNAIKSYLSKNSDDLEKLISKEATPHEINKIASTSILYKTSGNLPKSISTVNSNLKKVNNDSEKVLKTVDNKFSDQIIEKVKPVVQSNDITTKASDISRAVDNKSPGHLFQKRQIDFSINLKNDIHNSFKVLDKKDLPLQIKTINVVDKPEKKNEIDRSDISTVKIQLQDKFGNTHNVNIDIPRIDPKSGTFRVNGRKKCLVNQIVLCPITFPKIYESKFESSYSIFRIYSKRIRNKKYLDIYLGTYKLPLLLVMSYSFGFNESLKKFGISYKISDVKPEKTIEYFCRIQNNKFLIFENIDNDLKQEFVLSLIRENIHEYQINKEFGTKEYFNDLIYKITGMINSTYRITNTLDNIVDPVAKQVLMSKQLPTNLMDIMYYMSSKVITGYMDKRNDLANQRIRGSEVIVHLIQKKVLASYTVYREQVLSGNKNAKFEVNQTEVLSKFINSEIVTDMEYANPIEEMATMTRISPVGKDIGGIPDKEAIQNQARNVHDSYFGNIDPLDTPEGPNIGVTQQLTIDSLITNARGMFQIKPISDKEGSGILSTTSSMIPFIENNDGARVMMAVNQARQIVPLRNPEPPIVKSGYESILTGMLSDLFVKKSPCTGKIKKITDDNISILCKDGKITNVGIEPAHLHSGSGRDTLSIFKTVVKENENVREGQTIAEGSCINGGEISLGRTLCVGYLPYKGYNFEDAVTINERLVNDDKLTSLHGIVEEVLVSEKDRVLYIAQIGSKTTKGEPILRRTAGEIEELLGIDEEDETIENIGQQIIKKSPGGTVVDVDIFCNTDEDKFPLLKDLIQKTRKRFGVSPTDKFVVRGKSIKGLLIKFKIEQELKISLGDKLSNRYGGKGIVSLIEKEENMPRTPWGDRLDVILNPIGIINRMNIGQLYELYCGLISRTMGFKISTAKNRSEVISIFKQVLPRLDGTKNREFSSNTIKNLMALSNNQFSNMVNQIKSRGFSPIIIPPFKSPKPEQIMDAMKILNLKPGYELYLPEYGVKTKNPVPVGYVYLFKLEHISDLKIHARSTGPTISKTGQPTGGKSREGGQRLGEADVYSMLSYNCPVLLSEMLGPLSEDMMTKNEIISDIIQEGNANFRPAKVSPVRDLLNAFFVSLMLER